MFPGRRRQFNDFSSSDGADAACAPSKKPATSDRSAGMPHGLVSFNAATPWIGARNGETSLCQWTCGQSEGFIAQ